MNNLYLFVLLFFWVACSHPTPTQIQTHQPSDSLKYIKIEDALPLPGWQQNKTIVYQILSEPDNLHPTNGISALRHEVNCYIHKTLLTTNYQTLQMQPCLVKAMPTISQNGCAFTFELLPDIKWDNGQPLTVADIIFTAKAHACAYTQNANAKPNWDMVKDIIVDVENALMFTVVMKQPHIQNISMWGDYPIIQQGLYDTKQVLNKFSFDQLRNDTSNKELEIWANQFNQIDFRDVKNVSGLGDYKLAVWDAGIRLILVRKPHSTITTLPFADTLLFAISSDATAQMLEFKAQTFDASTTLSTKTLLTLQQDSTFNANYHSAFVSTFNYTYAAFNCKPDEKHLPFFTDKNVRRALALLTPVDQINKVLNQNNNKRLASPVSPVKDECNEMLDVLPFDVAKAKALLNKSGWIDSNQNGIRDKLINGKLVEFKFELMYFTNAPDWKDYAEMMATSYLSAGIEAVPTGYDPIAGQQKMFAQNFDMLLSSWGGNAGPEDYTQLWSTQAWKQKGANFAGFGNAFTDSVITAISQCMEADKRFNLSKQLQAIIYDEQPYVFLFTSMRKIAVHKRISNIELYFERPNLLLNQLQLKTNNPKTIQ